MRNERATVGTAKVHAVSPGLEKGEVIERRRTNLWNDVGPGQYLIQHHYPFSVSVEAGDKAPPSCQHTDHG